MKFSTFFFLTFPILPFCYPVIVEHLEISNRRIQTHNDPIHALHPRDSITFDVKSSFSNTTVSGTQNNAKFAVINNANNANIAMGDHTNHTADFHSFGDKNILNSTKSNTSGWNTKNHGTNPTTDKKGKRSREQKFGAPEGTKTPKKVARYMNVGVKQPKDGYQNEGNMPNRLGAQKLQKAGGCESGRYK
jgi:hypothetical protein